MHNLFRVMRITVARLKTLIREALDEISGPLRQVRDGGKQQYKVGKVEDENRELSFAEAEQLFPNSTNAWAEIVPELFPDFPFQDPRAIKMKSLFFKIGSELTVAFEEQPQLELAKWDPMREDWIENEFSSN